MGSTPEAGNGHGNNGQGRGTLVWTPPQRIEEDPEDESGLDFAHLWSVLREGRRAIALITFTIFAAVMFVTMIARMEFTLRGSLYLGDLQAKGGMLDALSAQFDLGMEKGDIGTEIEILRSRELMTRAILASGLNTQLTSQGWSAPRYWTWRLGHRDFKSLEGVWGELRAVRTRLTGTTSSPRELGIVFDTATEYELQENGKVLGRTSLGKPLVLPDIEVNLVAGSDRGPSAGNRYSLKVLPIEYVVDEAARHLSTVSPRSSPGSSVNVIHLEFTSQSPHQGRAFLEELMLGYLEQNLSWKTEEAAAAEAFLTKQLENVRASLQKAGEDLAAFKKESTSIVLSEEAKAMIEQMGRFEEQRVAARLQVAALGQVKSALAKGNAPTEAYLLGEAQDTVLIGMSESLAKSQLEYKRLSEQFTGDYPVVKEAKAALDSQLKAVRSYVNTRLSRAQEQVASLEDVLKGYADRLKELPDAELELASLTREADVYSKLYSFLLEHQQQAALTKASTISKSRVLDSPTLPFLETSPKVPIRAVLGLGAGLLLGIVFVFGRRRFSTTFQSETEVRKVLPGLSLFASIPRQPEEKRAAGNDAPRLFDVLASDLRSPFAEAFRLLRTNVYYSGSLDQDKVILVSSPGPGDGKTVTTLCLAGILAADGKQVLVVDGDMRKPSHHILLRQPQHPGLSGVLTSETHWSQTVHVVRSPFGDFSSISTGIVPPNPAELLSSPHLAKFLAEAREKFDFILLDSPPFPLVSDALVLSRHADRLLSVIRVGNTRRPIAEEHARRLAAATQRYGIVVNDVGVGSGYGYGYGTYGYGVSPDKRRHRWWKRKKNGQPNAPAD